MEDSPAAKRCRREATVATSSSVSSLDDEEELQIELLQCLGWDNGLSTLTYIMMEYVLEPQPVWLIVTPSPVAQVIPQVVEIKQQPFTKAIDLRRLSREVDRALSQSLPSFNVTPQYWKPLSTSSPDPMEKEVPGLTDHGICLGANVTLHGFPTHLYRWSLNQEQFVRLVLATDTEYSATSAKHHVSGQALSESIFYDESELKFEQQQQQQPCPYAGRKSHWCALCVPPQVATLNGFIANEVKISKHRNFSLPRSTNSSPWLLISIDTAEYWRDATFQLLHIHNCCLPANVAATQSAWRNLGELVTVCHTNRGGDEGPEGDPHVTPDILLNTEANSDGMWAIISIQGTDFFWYAVRHLKSATIDMYLHRASVNGGERQAYQLIGTGASCDDCRIYTNGSHLYCVVSQQRSSDEGRRKTTPPKLFRFDVAQDQMVEIELPPIQIVTVEDYRGSVDEEDLQYFNEENAIEKMAKDGQPLTISELEEYNAAQFLQLQPENKFNWQMDQVIVLPESGDLLMQLQQYEPYNLYGTPPPRSKLQTMYLYSVARQQWCALLNWPFLPSSVFGPTGCLVREVWYHAGLIH